MLDLEVAGSALRSTLWDVAIVGLVIGSVTFAVVAFWWVGREALARRDRRRVLRRLGKGSKVPQSEGSE